MKQQTVVQLSEAEHVLKRSARYLGPTTKTITTRHCLEDGKIEYKDIEIVLGLHKLIREIVDNSIDEAIRTNFKFANKIDIEITNEYISVRDNGRGIPVVHGVDSQGNKLDELMPTLAWMSLRSGSNFEDDDDNTTVGQNGEGASLVNVWSKLFKGITCDGKTYYELTCKDNMSSHTIKTKPSKQKYTKVTFYPDLERMDLKEIGNEYIDMLKFDLLFLKLTYDKIKFTLNGKAI